jgi:hypothetical protein
LFSPDGNHCSQQSIPAHVRRYAKRDHLFGFHEVLSWFDLTHGIELLVPEKCYWRYPTLIAEAIRRHGVDLSSPSQHRTRDGILLAQFAQEGRLMVKHKEPTIAIERPSPFNHVCVATDFSSGAGRALARAAHLPMIDAGKISVVHVLPTHIRKGCALMPQLLQPLGSRRRRLPSRRQLAIASSECLIICSEARRTSKSSVTRDLWGRS